jgi:hypothetical protein
MRATQWVGLSARALRYLERAGTKVPDVTCPKCKCVVSLKLSRKAYGNAYGMFGEEIPLYAYRLKDGARVREAVQAAPWSSGPMIFTCLVDDCGKKIHPWTERQIKKESS